MRQNAVEQLGAGLRTGVTSNAPVSNDASRASGRSRMVSCERGRWPSQPCRNGVTVAAAALHA